MESYRLRKWFPQSENYKKLDDVVTEKYDDNLGQNEVESIPNTSKENTRKSATLANESDT